MIVNLLNKLISTKKIKPNDIKVAYVCNRKKCDDCSYPMCKHTRDINYALNFKKLYKDIYEELENNKVKKIIDNKLYDTEKAIKLFEFKKEYPERSNFISYEYIQYDCTAYKTQKGAYFIYGIEITKECDKKELFRVLGEDEAKKLIMENSVEEYIKIFGGVEEG